MKKRVVLDPGHGGSQPGAVYGGLAEKDIVLRVAKYTQESISVISPDTWVGLTRDWDHTLTLQQRCDFSNNMKVDCFVSVHCNADPDDDSPGQPEAKGEEIWIYDNSVEGMKLAQCLKDEVDRIFPNEPFRGIKTTRPIGADKSVDKRPFLYVISYTNAPAVLIEIGFIDKSNSLETFTDELTLQKIGSFIAGGIYEYISKLG